MTIIEMMQDAAAVIEKYDLQSVFEVSVHRKDGIRIFIRKREEFSKLPNGFVITGNENVDGMYEKAIIGNISIACFTFKSTNE